MRELLFVLDVENRHVIEKNVKGTILVKRKSNLFYKMNV